MYIDITEEEVEVFKQSLSDYKKFKEQQKRWEENSQVVGAVASQPRGYFENPTWGWFLAAFFIGFVWGLICSRN